MNPSVKFSYLTGLYVAVNSKGQVNCYFDVEKAENFAGVKYSRFEMHGLKTLF